MYNYVYRYKNLSVLYTHIHIHTYIYMFKDNDVTVHRSFTFIVCNFYYFFLVLSKNTDFHIYRSLLDVLFILTGIDYNVIG